EATDALALACLLDPLHVDVGAGIVGGRMRGDAIRDSLDQRRPLAVARTTTRLARRFVAGEHVRAVDTYAGHPVAGRLVRERLRARLRLDGRRDRPAVVVAEQGQRSA